MHTAYLCRPDSSTEGEGAGSPEAWRRALSLRQSLLPATQRTAPGSSRWAGRANRIGRRRPRAWLRRAPATSVGWTPRYATHLPSRDVTHRPRESTCASRPGGAAMPSRRRCSRQPSASTARRPKPATGSYRPVSPSTNEAWRSTSGRPTARPGWASTACTTDCAGATRTNPGTSSCSRRRSASPAPRSSPTPTPSSGRSCAARLRLRLRLGFEALGVGLDVLDAAAHEERLLGIFVELALSEPSERVDGLVERDELARDPRELLGHEERLRQEALDPTGPVDQDAVLLGQLVDAQDGDDVLQVLVALEDLLHAAGDVVVVLAQVARVEDPRGRVERVDSRIDAELGDRPREHRRRVEVGERRVRSRVGDVVGRHVDRLQ